MSGREEFIIAKALFVAVRALRAQAHPPESNIADMERLLRERYPSVLEMLEMQNALKLAIRMGYKPHGVIDHEAVRAWLVEHRTGENVLALFDTPADYPEPPPTPAA